MAISKPEANTKSPTHAVYVVEERSDDQDPFWTRIGAAWPNKDGKGYNLQLRALPIGGRIVMREIGEEEAEEPKRKAK